MQMKDETRPSQAECSAAYDELVATPSNVVIERALRRRAEAELAALRRVDGDGMQATRRTGLPESLATRAWMVGDGSAYFGTGASIAEALADYDAKKEQR